MCVRACVSECVCVCIWLCACVRVVKTVVIDQGVRVMVKVRAWDTILVRLRMSLGSTFGLSKRLVSEERGENEGLGEGLAWVRFW